MQVVYIVLAILLLLFFVLVHELGHYIIGKALKFKIIEFSIGFGPKIYAWKRKNGEIISLRVFPLGGYCSFYDEEVEREKREREEAKKNEFASKPSKIENASDIETSTVIDSSISDDTGSFTVINNAVSEDKQAKGDEYISQAEISADKKKRLVYTNSDDFNTHHPLKRIAVLLGGVAFNFIFAVLLSFIVLAGFGESYFEIQNTQTFTYYQEATDTLSETSKEIVVGTTAHGKLQQGDLIVKINGKDMHFFYDMSYISKQVDKLEKQGKHMLPITVYREGEGYLDFEIEIAQGEKLSLAQRIGFTTYKPQRIDEDGTMWIQYQNVKLARGIGYAALKSVGFCLKLAGYIISLIASIFTGLLSLGSLTGPVGTISAIAEVIKFGSLEIILLLSIMMSVNLAAFNILPIPALDGSRIIFTLIEWIRGRPINRNIEAYIHFAGFVLLIGFVVFIDIFNLFR